MSRSGGPDLDRLRGRAGPWALAGVNIWTGGEVIDGAIGFGADGRVAALGSSREVRAALPRGSAVVRGGGAWVVPGFVDPHVHVRAAASAWHSIDVSSAHTPPEVVAAVARACRHGHDWVTLLGLDLETFAQGRSPDRQELDAVSRGLRVRIRDGSGHGWLFNSAGLAAIGVRGEAGPKLPAGVIVERRAGGDPTGFVADSVGWVGDLIGRVTSEDLLAQGAAGWSRDLARAGVVAICDATPTNRREEAHSLLRWRRDGRLLQELTLLLSPESNVEGPARESVAGVKFAAADDPRLGDALRAARRTDGAVAVHCLEPAEVGAVIATAERVPALLRGRLRLEHAAQVPPDWLPAIRDLGATVVTHPSFIAAKGDRYLADADLEPRDWLYRLASWVEAGVPLAFASDAPFGPYQPLGMLRAAASRQTAAGRVIGPAEALCGEAALRALTTVAADCAGLGRLGYGKLAAAGPGAAVVLSHDPRRPERLAHNRVLATVIGGKVVD